MALPLLGRYARLHKGLDARHQLSAGRSDVTAAAAPIAQVGLIGMPGIGRSGTVTIKLRNSAHRPNSDIGGRFWCDARPADLLYLDPRSLALGKPEQRMTF